MHISEAPPGAVTKCASEEEPLATEGVKDAERRPSATPGGRLKFFKDGKFILELERAREGERISWVSVPRKTFWPPAGPAASTTPPNYSRQDGLSVSDDNSSVQSSPWQRDHSWKQSTPKRNTSNRTNFVFFIKNKKIRKKCRKRRRPFSGSPEPPFAKCNNNKTPIIRKKRTLNEILERLTEKDVTVKEPVRDIKPLVVSPRKRILREMERLNTAENQEQLTHKRIRSKSTLVTTAGTNSVVVVKSEVKATNGEAAEANRTIPLVKSSCYSINSLLADDKSVVSKKTSVTNVPSPYMGPQHFNSPPGASSEERWYSESVDKLRSIELNQAEKRAYYYPYMPPPHYMYPYSPYYYGRGPPFNMQQQPQSIYHHNHTLGSPVLPVISTPRPPHLPTCSWTPETSSRSDDNVTDMPLNLSKHSG